MKMTSSAVMKALFPKSSLCLFSLATLLGPFPAFAMVEMKDEQLSEVTGQALLQMGKTPSQTGSDNLTFYKAGLDAQLELNMNIDKLQLGCTAGLVNGQNCDIDIDNLSLSGNSWNEGRPESSALLTRPFFEFAIKNDHEKTLREVVGIRMSAEDVSGMLTFGTENSSTPNGINSLSGYMRLMQASGAGDALPINMAYGCNQSENSTSNCGSFIDPVTMRLNGTGVDCAAVDCTIATNTALLGSLCLWLAFECLGNDAGEQGNTRYSSTDYVLPLRASGTTTYPVTGAACPPNKVCFTTQPTTVSGKRLSSVQLTGTANIPTISFGCESECAFAETSYLGIDLNAQIQGTMSGLKANVPIVQALGMIHKLNVQSRFSLSMQSSDVLWPNENAVAESGWWMAFNDPVDLGNIDTANPLAFTPEVLQQALCSPAGQNAGGGCTGGNSYNGHNTGPIGGGGVNDSLWYQRGGAVTESAIGTLISPTINVGDVPLSAVVEYPFNNPQLSAQSFTPNCWGSAKFC